MSHSAESSNDIPERDPEDLTKLPWFMDIPPEQLAAACQTRQVRIEQEKRKRPEQDRIAKATAGQTRNQDSARTFRVPKTSNGQAKPQFVR